MPAPDPILKLIDRFDANQANYRAGRYKEMEVRSEFIDPFLKELGWDIGNNRGLGEAYKEVVYEEALRIGSSTKAPDYSLRIGGQRKLFVEAKKPSVNIKDSASPAFQVRRYAWSAKLPVSILTDFEEFAVYDCTDRPDLKDSPHHARLMYYEYGQYHEKWDELVGLFSPDAIMRGSIDQLVQPSLKKRGTAAVDEAFLVEISEWRELLAKNIALRNPGISTRQLNQAVQATIDRLIFLRIAEDRGIEGYGRLRDAAAKTDVYAELGRLFHLADQKYNSGLFHFQREKGRDMESLDAFTLQLRLDDKPLNHIIKRLYYPESPYQFDMIPPDILGQVYEQFLGKVIQLTPGGQAIVEDKPEVKKAGGVFYTPTYIVEYIVKQTVGKLLEGKTAGLKGDASKLRILDPACGSGSFLLGAYQYLLDWHLAAYLPEAERWARGKEPTIFQNERGEWRLTLGERKRILLNNIYGVDIDTQAVEVTKLSLLLKVMEGTGVGQLRLLPERVLPDLGRNIKCGNSLIGPNFYDNRQLSLGLLDEEEMYRLNVFDWTAAFPDIVPWGGFDAVIGNPPYVFTRNQGIDAIQKLYFYSNYKYQSTQLNTFGLFVERCHLLLKREALLGFIIPNNWLTISSFSILREFILSESGDVQILNILDRVFKANVDTAIVIFRKSGPTRLTIGEIEDQSVKFTESIDLSLLSPPDFIIQIGLLRDVKAFQVLNKIEEMSVALENFATVSTGLKAYQTGKGKPPQVDYHKENRVFHSTKKENETFGRYLQGADVNRFYLRWSGEHLSYGDWLAETRRTVPYVGNRILVRQIPSLPPYTVNGVFLNEAYYNDINSMVIFDSKAGVSLEFLLGCLNSRLLSFWFLKKFDKLQRKIFPQFKVGELKLFPIRNVNLESREDKELHDEITETVRVMQELHKRLATAQASHEKTVLQRQIAATDRQIDQLVYRLYDLTPEEIAFVEAQS